MARAKGHRTGSLHLLRSYSFVTKDPVIDKLRTLMAREGLSKGKIARISGLTESTISAWFDGDTRRPQYASVQAFTRSLGYTTKFVKARAVDFEKEFEKATAELAELKARLERKRSHANSNSPRMQAAE
jgi:transcriptional regulator with XRE-family HTH domain